MFKCVVKKEADVLLLYFVIIITIVFYQNL